MRLLTIAVVLHALAGAGCGDDDNSIGDIGLAAGETPGTEEFARLQEAFSSINDRATSTRISTWANENC